MSHPYENVDNPPGQLPPEDEDLNIAVTPSASPSVAGSARDAKAVSSERQIKFERAQKCLENAALVSKRIKEHRKATAELLGRQFEEDDVDAESDIASTMSERTGFSAATDISTTLSVQDALNIPGISESLANTLKQKEILMERIKQYKEISKRPSIAKSSPISRRESVSDPKSLTTKPMDSNEKAHFQNRIREKENALSIMQVKIKAMETTILDLQEKISEKDQILDAKTRATSLMSDSLGKKEKDSFALLEDTRQQMTKMQENFITMESEWKKEKERLYKEITEKDEKINSLQEANTILENSRFEISVAHSKLAEELEIKINQIAELEGKLLELSTPKIETKSEDVVQVDQEKGSLEISNMSELTKKVELLEQLNCTIRQTNKELEIKLASVSTNPEPKSPSTSSPSKKASPLPTRRGGRNTAAKSKSPWRNMASESSPQSSESKKQPKVEEAKLDSVIQSLNKDLLEMEYTISQKDALLSELKATVTEKEALIDKLSQQQAVETHSSNETFDATTNTDDSKVHSTVPADIEGTIDTAMVNELEDSLKAAQEQISSLTEEIATANKNMIKVKANHKLKLKQMQKTIDNFSKVSDANAEIIKLNEELTQLQQKTAELEEEKGSLQLHLVDYDGGRLTESDVYKKLMETENLAESRLNAITVLETQKFDLVQELHDLRQKNEEMEDKLADMTQLQNEQVCSEMKSVQLEEQIDNLLASKQQLELVIKNLKYDSEQSQQSLEQLKEEKDEITHKLNRYIQENMDLTDKIEKMSADKVSSAESIEIVDPLTTQEKLELEEYNKRISDSQNLERPSSQFAESVHERDDIEKLVAESAELNKKIELFTQERQEVMEKLNILSTENDQLSKQILQLTSCNNELETNIDTISREKNNIQALNDELNRQIEELKRERIEIAKESVETNKPASIDEPAGAGAAQDVQSDEKATDKNKAKMVKQLTKDILKLKNAMKEREDELSDCQMKILSMEEQQQKQIETIAANAAYEAKLLEENASLKNAISNLQRDKELENQLTQLKQNNEQLHYELQKLRQEYGSIVEVRDLRIQELENLLRDYEHQIYNYNSTLQQKDKEITEYLNQITKLNEVSQKLRSTVEILEEEKSNDPNAELVKSLNKQVALLQNKLAENEEKLRFIEDEKSQLLSLKTLLETQSQSLEVEINNMKESLTEKQTLINKLQSQQDKYAEEMSLINKESKERDEQIHEIKLQLRKESIENEKLRNDLTEKEKAIESYINELTDIKDTLNKAASEKDSSSDQYIALETKNKELMEKLKKYAATLKKKTAMFNDLDVEYNKLQKELEVKNSEIEQLGMHRDILPSLQEKLKCAEEELNRIHAQRLELEQRSMNQDRLFEQKLLHNEQEFSKLSESFNVVNFELNSCRQENATLVSQIDAINKKVVEYEIELKNNTNYLTKISSLENDIGQKDAYITQLLEKISSQEQAMHQHQYGIDAKIQERELYIENLQTEIQQYKNRISRLEDSVSTMEERRRSLERKADQLDSQLHEKQQAYSCYSSQEDELVDRLAGLMDHDRVLEKQLQDIERENHDSQNKIHNLQEENQRFRTIIGDLQQQCAALADKAARCDRAEAQAAALQDRVRELEQHLKKIAAEHQSIVEQNRKDIRDLEEEFNTQIEEAIKEKKTLSEKYEKLNEVSMHLQQKLSEHSSNVQNLNHSLEEMSRCNEELNDRLNSQRTHAPEYIEQLMNEISKLNATIDAKNQEINDVIEKSTNQQHYLQAEVNSIISENNSLKANTEELMAKLAQTESQLNQLVEQKKHISFEMNIPKTEGLLISSTIEEVKAGGERQADLASIEAQMVSGEAGAGPAGADTPDRPQAAQGDVEPLIVPKKAYLCYTKQAEDSPIEADPFNSDEGWGLGEEEAAAESKFMHFKEQLTLLKSENEKLQKDLTASNTKLLKAMKKLKELKSTNEMLSKEVSLSKQMSSSFLDSAIEDELKSHIANLEKRVEELNNDLVKEKRDRDSMRKQNEVFQNANDKYMEMKEKLDNEVELWKFKFKEANDKLDTLQWGGEAKTPEHKPRSAQGDESRLREEIIKLEKENDELQNIIDDITARNKELTSEVNTLKMQIQSISEGIQRSTSNSQQVETLTKELEVLQNLNKDLTDAKASLEADLNSIQMQQSILISQEVDKLKNELLVIQNENKELSSAKDTLENEIISMKSESSEMMNSFEILNVEYNHAKKQVEDYNALAKKCQDLEQESNILNQKLEEANETISSLNAELAEHRGKLEHQQQLQPPAAASDGFIAAERTSQLENQLQDMSAQLARAEHDKADLAQQHEQHESQLKELHDKIAHLNSENDQLLSNMAEARASLVAAVDQRGYEIAELWKQHLAQREAEFQQAEQQLRAQLAAADARYDQLLDSVQSSSQEETSALVELEQLSSLQAKLQDKEDRLASLQAKFAEVVGRLDQARAEFEDEKVMYENKLLALQEEHDKLTTEASERERDRSGELERTVGELRAELDASRSETEHLKKELEETNRLRVEVEQQVMDLSGALRMKDAEIQRAAHEYALAIAQRNEELAELRLRVGELEKRVEDAAYEKESELAVLRLAAHEATQLQQVRAAELEARYAAAAQELEAKAQSCNDLSRQLHELNKSLEENATKFAEMEAVLESQEMDVVALKDENDHLRDLMNKTRHVSFAEGTKSGAEADGQEAAALLEAVPRAELDLALYMLHQRDVRCEELTVELTQLLEERDTLQLRLSDSIRFQEELKTRCKSVGIETEHRPASGDPPRPGDDRQPEVAVHGQPRTSISEEDERPKLQAKLSELRSVRQSRDVRLREDSAARQRDQRDLRLLRRDVARLPPAAVASLEHAHHTLSRDSQSTSTVLLNWLRGKGTPKAVQDM